MGWFYDDGEEPSDSSKYTSEEDLFAALDQAIEKRSKRGGNFEGLTGWLQTGSGPVRPSSS